MPTIKRNTAFDVISRLPDWQSFSAPDVDAFVCAAGFEERSIFGFREWCRSSGKARVAILIRYPYNRLENEVSEAEFSGEASRANVRVIWIDYNKLSIVASLSSVSAQIAGRPLIVDISTMASFVIYPVFRWIFKCCSNQDVHVVYTEAGEYYPLEAEWEQFKARTVSSDLLQKARAFDEIHFQSEGVDSIYEPFGYEGGNLDNLLTCFLIVPNFSFERIQRMIEYAKERYPDSAEEQIWFLGRPPDTLKNGWRFEAVREMYGEPKSSRAVCTLKYKEMILALDEVWAGKSYSNSFMIITAGSKCQHLGTVLFEVMHPDVGVILSEPAKFTADRYSKLVGPSRILCLNAGTVSRLKMWNGFQFSW